MKGSDSEKRDSKIDFRNIDMKDAVNADFPASVKDEFRVYFSESAYKDMMKHSNITSEVELGGILLGDLCHDNRGFFLQITAVIEGQHSNNYGTQITFTHNTWQHFNEVKDSKYPNKRIVGWYHTHPGFGIFLSEMDYFIQENFFNQPYQIAVVVETKKHAEGAFAWENGKCVPLSRYWAGNKEIKLMEGSAEAFALDALKKTEENAPRTSTKEPEPRVEGTGMIMIMTALLMVFTFLLGMYWGKGVGIAELENKTIQMIQSEFYSILEYASFNAGAKLDFESVQKQVDKAAADLKLGKTREAAKTLAGTNKYIDELKKTYSANRIQFRKDIENLKDAKCNMSAMVNKCMTEQGLINRKLAEIYLIKIKELIEGAGVPFENMSPEQQYVIRSNLSWILQTCPEMKASIKMLLPELFKSIYAPETKEKQNLYRSEGNINGTGYNNNVR